MADEGAGIMTKVFSEFESLRESSQGWQPNWLKPLASEAAKSFSELGLPDRKTEEWKYTDLGFLSEFIGKGSTNVAHAGHSVDLTKLGVSEANVLGELRSQINGWLKESAIENLNLALVNGGSVLRVPRAKSVIDSYKHEAKGWLSPRTAIILDENAELTLFEENSAGENSIVNSMIDVKLAPGAKFRFVRLQNNHRQSNHISTVRVLQKENSTFEYFNFAFGSNVSRDNVYCRLEGSNALCELKGLGVAGPGQHLDQFVFVDHASPSASSRQQFKNIVSNRARAVFNGKVVVQKGSSGTDAQQLNKNLLLGKMAEIDARPQLEIANDDVKCSHGSTIGRLSPDELFYLQSRGISKKQSVDLLCRAFVDELVLKIENPAAQERVKSTLAGFFSELETDYGS